MLIINSYVIRKTHRTEYALSNRFYIEESLDIGVTGEGMEDPSFQAVNFAIILVT